MYPWENRSPLMKLACRSPVTIACICLVVQAVFSPAHSERLPKDEGIRTILAAGDIVLGKASDSAEKICPAPETEINEKCLDDFGGLTTHIQVLVGRASNNTVEAEDRRDNESIIKIRTSLIISLGSTMSDLEKLIRKWRKVSKPDSP